MMHRQTRARRWAALLLVSVLCWGGANGAAAADTVAGVPGTPRERERDTAEAQHWTWPVAAPIVIVNPWRAPETKYAAGHRGVDLRAVQGSEVVAPAAGAIRFAGLVAGRPVVSIDHGGGVVSSVEAVQPHVRRGDRVSAGQVLGTVAGGSHCDGCVHFGVRIDGEYVSPMRFYGGVEPAVLLPLGRAE